MPEPDRPAPNRRPPHRDPVFRLLGLLFTLTFVGMGALALWEGVASGHNSRHNLDFFIEGRAAWLWGASWVALALVPLGMFFPHPRVGAWFAIVLASLFGVLMLACLTASS